MFPAIALVVASLLASTAAQATACGDSVKAFLDSATSAGIKVRALDVDVRAPDGATLRRIKRANTDGTHPSVRYLIDLHNNLWFVDELAEPVKFAKGEIPVARLRDAATGEVKVLPVLESGELTYRSSEIPLYKRVLFGKRDPNKLGFVMEKKTGFALDDEESAAAFRQIDELGEGDAVARVARKSDGFDQARTVKCNDILDNYTRGDKFVIDKLGIDMALLTASIMVMAPERYEGTLAYYGAVEREAGRDYDEDMLAADYVTTPIYTLLGTSVSLALVKKNAGLASSLSTRAGVSLASVGLQSIIYATMTDEGAKGVGLYNLGYSVLSITKAHYLDKWMYNKLPAIAYKSCLANSALRIVTSPVGVRIVENLGSKMVYFGGRELFVGE